MGANFQGDKNLEASCGLKPYSEFHTCRVLQHQCVMWLAGQLLTAIRELNRRKSFGVCVSTHPTKKVFLNIKTYAKRIIKTNPWNVPSTNLNMPAR